MFIFTRIIVVNHTKVAKTTTERKRDERESKRKTLPNMMSAFERHEKCSGKNKRVKKARKRRVHKMSRTKLATTTNKIFEKNSSFHVK